MLPEAAVYPEAVVYTVPITGHRIVALDARGLFIAPSDEEVVRRLRPDGPQP